MIIRWLNIKRDANDGIGYGPPAFRGLLLFFLVVSWCSSALLKVELYFSFDFFIFFSLSLFYAFAAPKLDSTSVKANVRVLLKFFRMFRSAMAGNGGSWFFFSREFRIVSRKSSQLFKNSERQRSGHRTLQQNRFICILIYYFPIFKNVFL